MNNYTYLEAKFAYPVKNAILLHQQMVYACL